MANRLARSGCSGTVRPLPPLPRRTSRVPAVTSMSRHSRDTITPAQWPIISAPFTGSCATSSGCPPWARSRCPASLQPATATPSRLSWKYWSRRPRTAGSGASAGCAPRPGCRRARPGKPSSTTGCLCLSDSNWGNWPTAASSTAASTSWPSVFPAPGKHTPCAPWATGWWSRAGRCSSPRPTGWCRICWQPSGT